MAILEKLAGTNENVANIAAYVRGKELELNEHELLLLDALTAPEGAVHALGKVTLGRGVVEYEHRLFQNSEQLYPYGRVVEDFENPDGVWLDYIPL